MFRPRRSTASITLALAAGALAVPAAANAAFAGRTGDVAYVQTDFRLRVMRLADINADAYKRLPFDDPTLGPDCNSTDGRPRYCLLDPAYSPDGRTMAVGVDDLGSRQRYKIATMTAGGTDVREIATPGLTEAYRPAWSPDGHSIIFQGTTARIQNLYMVRADGSGLRQLTHKGGAQPAWSSDGRIAFRRDGNLWIMRADGTGLRRLTGRGGSEPDFSPHSSELVFSRAHNIYRLGLRSKSLKTGSVKLVARGTVSRTAGGQEKNLGEPVYTPDGRWIVFDHGHDTASGAISRVRLDGSGRYPIAFGYDYGGIHAVESPAVRPLV